MSNKFESLKKVAAKLQLDYRTLLALIDCHPDLLEALKPYRSKENARHNKRGLPPTVTKLIYDKFML